jgi:hypothetical protein
MKPLEEIEKNHPRFKELCEIHGTPTANEASQKASSSVLKDRLLGLHLFNNFFLCIFCSLICVFFFI